MFQGVPTVQVTYKYYSSSNWVGFCDECFTCDSQAMDPMVEAAKCGLRVDMASLPTLNAGGVAYAAGQQAPGEVVDEDRVQEMVARGRDDTFAEINSELKKQSELCKANIAQFKAVGDVASVKRYFARNF